MSKYRLLVNHWFFFGANIQNDQAILNEPLSFKGEVMYADEVTKSQNESKHVNEADVTYETSEYRLSEL